MNPAFLFERVELWQTAGWTMLHFLWLGMLVGLVALMGRWMLRRAVPAVRYVAALAALALLAALPIAIAAWLVKNQPVVLPVAAAVSDQHVSEIVPLPSQPSNQIIELHTPQSEETALTTSGPAGGFAATMGAEPGGTRSGNPHTTEQGDLAGATGFASATDQLWQRAGKASGTLLSTGTFIAWLESAVSYLPWLWLIGTPLTLVLLTTGLIGSERLRRVSRVIEEGPIAEAVARLTQTLHIGRRVTVAVCERIAAPVLVGIVRPMILLPPAALTGWSLDEIEMVLLHELAHVRRWDNLVNLVQRCIESLLFFHPAVWLVSGWVRREREACCDAVVVARTNRPHAYAEMLVALAAQMPRSVLFHPAASSAMAAGPLRGRIRQILQLEEDPMLVSGKSFAMVLGSLVVAVTLAVLYLPRLGQAEEAVAEKENAEKLAIEGTETTEIADRKAKSQTQNQLNQLIIALLNHEAAYRSFPASASFDANGKPLLSWRVHILPFLEEEKLYREFHLDEPWDSEHNRTLIPRMPEAFKNPKLNELGKTNYLAVVGKECVFDGSPKGLGLEHITDGTSKTIAIVEVNSDLSVEWTKPQDWNFDRANPTQGLGKIWPDGWYAAWVDGSIRRVENGESADQVGIQFTCAGREVASLQESANRPATAGEGEPASGLSAVGEAGPSASPFGDAPLAAGSEPDVWPKGIAFPSPKEGEISRQAWQRLGLKIVPASKEELHSAKLAGYKGGLKVVSGKYIPSGLPEPVILLSLDEAMIHTFEDLQQAIDKIAQWERSEVNMTYLAGGQLYSSRFVSPAAPVPTSPLQPTVNRQAQLPFPTLEDQKLADLAWKRLGLELEPISGDDLKRVQALGFDGGLKVSSTGIELQQQRQRQQGVRENDILVGLHVWPTTNLKQVAEVLKRDDLAELNPLKYYAVRLGLPLRAANEYRSGDGPPEVDTVFSGRLGVQSDRTTRSRPQSPESKPAENANIGNRYSAPATDSPYGRPTTPATAGNRYSDAPVQPAIRDNHPEPMANQPMGVAQTPQPGATFSSAPWEPASGPVKDAWNGQPQPLGQRTLPGGTSDEKSLLVQSGQHVLPEPVAERDESANASTTKPAAGDPFHAEAPGNVMIKRILPDGKTVFESQPAAPLAASALPPVPGNAPTKSDVANNKAKLRYDGMTFYQWSNAWRTELSTEKRLEAVKALAAFGRAGYGKEATEAILDVAGEYDFSILQGSENEEGKLQETVINQLAPYEYRRQSLAQYWVPDLAKRLEQEPKKWAMLGYWLLSRLKIDDPGAIAILQSLAHDGPTEVREGALMALVQSAKPRDGMPRFDDQTRELLAAALKSEDLGLVSTGLPLLIYNPPFAGGVQPSPELLFQPELIPLLFHKEEGIRFSARGKLRYIQEKDAPPVVQELIAVLKDESRKPDRLNAIRGLAAMGERAKEAEKELKQVVQSNDPKLALPALVAIHRIMGKGNERLQNDVLTAALGDHPADLGPELGEAFDREQKQVLPPENAGRGGGFGGGGGGIF